LGSSKNVYSSQSDKASGEEEKENSEGAYPCEGELMMIYRTPNNQPNMNQETQRKNIFHTRCKVFENVCSLIVDNGSYCDVVLMEACHILLGRPWQFDKKTMHNGLTNEFTFTHKEKKFVLYPLSSSQVIKGQVQMRKKKEEEKKKRERRKQRKSP